MSVKPNKKPSFALGLILILLLLAAVILGGSWVVRQAFLPRQSDARPAAAAVSGQPDAAAQLPVQTAEETVSGAQPEAVPEPAAEPEPEPARVTLMAVGDDLIHNCVYWSAETPEGGYDFTPFFDDIRPIVQQYDLACINQETILVQDRSLIASYPIFGSPIEVADALADAGFNVVTFAGNHCFDKKETGVTDTLRYFHETYPDITTLGIHDSEADAAVIPIVEKNGIRIAMLNFTYGLNNSMPEKRWMVDMLSSTDTVCGRIAQAKQEADFVIVFPHWGTEDELSPDESQLRWAQEMADAGADLIIGGHPHTLQPTGLLTAADGRDVPVYYSLGNFLSSPDSQKYDYAMESVILNLEFTKNGKTGDTSLTGIQYTPLYILKTENEAEGVRYQVVPIRSAISNNLFPDMESTFTDAIAHLRTNTDSDYDSGK